MDELERSLRELLTDERLDVPVRPGAVSAVHDGIRRRRAATRAVMAVSAVVAVLLGTAIVAAGSGLPHKAKLALGGEEDPPGRSSPPAKVSPAPTVSKPPAPQRIAWNPRPYDGRHPMAFPEGDVPPDCTSDQLTLDIGGFQSAGGAAGPILATNHGAPCTMRGAPTVVGVDDGGAVIATQTPTPATTVISTLLPTGESATATVVIYSDTAKCLGSVARLDVSVTTESAPVSLAPQTFDGGEVPVRCGTVPEDQQQDHYDLSVDAWRVVDATDARDPLAAGLRKTPPPVMQGTFLHYQVNVDAGTAGERPCRPFRERLVRTDDTVVAEAAYLLPCPAIRAASSDSVYLDMQLYVPSNVQPGELRLEWDTPGNERIVAPVRVTAAPPQCEQQQLQTTGYGNGAAGSLLGRVIFENTSTSECSLFGYPGVEFVSSDGRHLATNPHKKAWPRTMVALGPGDKASFLVSTLSFKPPGGAEPCREVSGIDVIAPGLFTQVLVPGVATYCLDGDIDVWPVVEGTEQEP